MRYVLPPIVEDEFERHVGAEVSLLGLLEGAAIASTWPNGSGLPGARPKGVPAPALGRAIRCKGGTIELSGDVYVLSGIQVGRDTYSLESGARVKAVGVLLRAPNANEGTTYRDGVARFILGARARSGGSIELYAEEPLSRVVMTLSLVLLVIFGFVALVIAAIVYALRLVY
jgi:hypothetical protein